MHWQYALIVFAAFVASSGTSLLQHRSYQRTVNRVAEQEHRSGVALVTGRAKGKLRGAIVLLVIDRGERKITRAMVMQGASAFARFAERPELTGPVTDAQARARSKSVSRAMDDALDRYRRMTAGSKPKPVLAKAQPANL